MKKNKKIIAVKYYLFINNKPPDKSGIEISRKMWIVLIESCVKDGEKFSIKADTWNPFLRKENDPHEVTAYTIFIKE